MSDLDKLFAILKKKANEHRKLYKDNIKKEDFMESSWEQGTVNGLQIAMLALLKFQQDAK